MPKLGSMLLSFFGGVLGSIAVLGIIGANPASKDGSFNRVTADSIVARHVMILDVNKVKGKGRIYPAVIEATEDGSTISLHSEGGRVSLGADRGGAHAFVDKNVGKGPSVGLFYDHKEDRATLEADDASGVARVVVGQTSLVTKSSGVKEDTPAGAITIFDDGGNVMWRAPR